METQQTSPNETVNWFHTDNGVLIFEQKEGGNGVIPVEKRTENSVDHEIETGGESGVERERFPGYARPWDAFAESVTEIHIGEGIPVIPAGAFSGLPNLRKVILPAGLKTIEKQAFQNCPGLEYLLFSDGPETIGAAAFASCGALRAVTLPPGLKTIGRDAFLNCKGLEHVVFPEGLRCIGSSAFGGCGSLRSVSLPDSVTSVGEGAFTDCEEVILPKNIRDLNENFGTDRKCKRITSRRKPLLVKPVKKRKGVSSKHQKR